MLGDCVGLSGHRVVGLLLGLVVSVAGSSRAGAQSLVEQSIEIGQEVSGSLTNEDGVEPSRGTFADLYSFEAYAGDRVEILLMADVIDTYVLLRDPSGAVMAEDDDGGGNLDSRLLVTVPLDGLYGVVATSYSVESGEYRVLVREYRPQPVAFATAMMGVPANGALTETDAVRTDNRRVDGFTFDATAGERVRVTMWSTDIDTYLYVLAPTGELLGENDDAPNQGTNSEVSVQLPYTGSYQVLATTYATAFGTYGLQVDPFEPAPIQDLPIELDATANGRLEGTDGMWLPRSTFADGYVFEGSAGQQVEVGLISSELDPYLVVLGPDGTVMGENDDSGGGRGSLVVARLPSDGLYRVIATSYETAQGSYTLSLFERDYEPLTQSSVSVGDVVDAELSVTDPLRYYEAAHVDLYELDLEQAQRVVVTMRSPTLNSWMWILAPSGELVGNDDDSGGGLDALIDFTAPFDGTYLVVATSYAGATGPYQLAVTDGSVPPPATLRALGMGEAVSGTLERTDPASPATGLYQDSFTFQGRANEPVEIRLTSTEFDPYLTLVAPDGLILIEDDDGGGGVAARIQAMLPLDGTYVVHASSFAMAVGSYVLTVTRFDPAAVAPNRLDIGATLPGTLSPADIRSARYGSLLDAFEMTLEQGQRIQIDMSSDVLDAYLVLIDPNGEIAAEDDDSGGFLNARVDLTVPMTGRYRLIATTATATYAEGPYTITTSSGEPMPHSSPFHSP